MKRKLVVGTRGSELALVQTRWVIEGLRERFPALEFEERVIKTRGDMILDVSLDKVGGKGLFVKEIEKALLEGEIDLAVHSMKDLPTELPDGLVIGAVCEREDPRDAFVSADGRGFAELKPGARIGTSSLRRGAQLKHARPDLEIVPIRGNVDTRLAKVRSEGLAGAVLAVAGLERLGRAHEITERLDLSLCLPAVGQGAIGVEVREDDDLVREVVGALDHRETRLAVAAERAFMRRLEGGCHVPVAALARAEGEALVLEGLVAAVDGSAVVRGEKRADLSPDGAAQVGVELAEELLAMGGEMILARLAAAPGRNAD